MRLPTPALLPLIALDAILVSAPVHGGRAKSAASVPRVIVNDNRQPAGTLRAGVLTLRIEARLADWHPDGEDAVGATVPAFAEEGRSARIPGPLIRVPAGTEVALSLHNALAQVLIVRGLDDRLRGTTDHPAERVIELAPGVTRAVRVRLDAPGTYFYYGSTRQQTIDWRSGDDSQLGGAIVVDPPGTHAATDRIFVLGVWSDTAGRVLAQRRRILSTVNGRSWPSTERLRYAVGDSVHWRVINASADSHPMHLHGFYYVVDARGDDTRDTAYAPEQRRRANTAELPPGTTMALTWVPERPGNWLFHCHLPDHFRANGPLGMLRTSADVHATTTSRGAMNHALSEMNGLVMGVIVSGKSSASPGVASAATSRALRLLIRPSAGGSAEKPFYAFSIHAGGAEPPPDSGLHVGPVLVLTRGERTSITVVNSLDKPTAVHWHGIELESYFDGVAGFSGQGTRIAPVIAPHDSFVAHFTPPRAGTFIYHTHVDETVQQLAGLAGPLIVLEPGRTLDSTTDHTVLITTPTMWQDELRSVLINGRASPAPLTVQAGVPQRLRFINMTTRRPRIRAELWRDSTLVTWRPLAKDGADLPTRFQGATPARAPISIGETMDFEFFPPSAGDWHVVVRGLNGAVLSTLPIRVLASSPN
jgi:FtsP/CotA-like multicopper oxidase with cupredoxin domain